MKHELLPDLAPSDATMDEASREMASTLQHFLCRRDVLRNEPMRGVVIGELIAIRKHDRVPFVLYPGQFSPAAIPARTVVDLHGRHIGQPVAISFDGGDPCLPIIMGIVRGGDAWPLADPPAQVEVDADGQRMLVSAKSELVLRCGKASLTMTRAGKIIVEGTYIVSQSSGANRIKGGSVEIN